MAVAVAESVSDVPVSVQSTDPSDAESAISAQNSDLTPKSVAAVGLSKGGQDAALIEVLREQAKQADPTISDKDPDDETLARFLKATNSDVPKSCKMYVQHRMWRKTFVPKGYISEPEISGQLSAQKVFLQVKDGMRPVLVIQVQKHDAHNRDLEEFKRFTVYNIDKLIASLPAGESQFVVVVDFANSGYKNLDSRGMIAILDFLQAQYPERLGRLFMMHVPYVFWGVWKIVSPFVDKVTREKIVFVEDKSLEDSLKRDISPDMLPQEYGGTGALVLIDKVNIPDRLSEKSGSQGRS